MISMPRKAARVEGPVWENFEGNLATHTRMDAPRSRTSACVSARWCVCVVVFPVTFSIPFLPFLPFQSQETPGLQPERVPATRAAGKGCHNTCVRTRASHRVSEGARAGEVAAEVIRRHRRAEKAASRAVLRGRRSYGSNCPARCVRRCGTACCRKFGSSSGCGIPRPRSGGAI